MPKARSNQRKPKQVTPRAQDGKEAPCDSVAGGEQIPPKPRRGRPRKVLGSSIPGTGLLNFQDLATSTQGAQPRAVEVVGSTNLYI